MTGSQRIAAVVAAAVALFASSWPAAADRPRPIESTLSYQLLQTEAGVRQVSAQKFALLRSVLERAMNAATEPRSVPRTRKDAIEALDAIQIAMTMHNFIQPTEPEERASTLADAFEPLQLSPAERRALLAPGEVNGFRARYIDPTKPLYFIDAAIASQLIISVGQRLGWDIRLVTVHEHYFVRWHLNRDVAINWDWTAGGPTRNEDYSAVGGTLYLEWPQRVRHLRSLPLGYARAHYLFLMSRHIASAAAKRRLLELAMNADATHEGTQNGLAWIYVTDPALARTHGRRAVAYALSAWAASPSDGNVADTVACAFAATGQRNLAAQTERFAIARLTEARSGSLQDYQNRLRQIEAGGLCSAN